MTARERIVIRLGEVGKLAWRTPIGVTGRT
jgi:hypothetical protein